MIAVITRCEQSVSVTPPKTVTSNADVPVLLMDLSRQSADDNFLTCFIQNVGGDDIYYSFDFDTPNVANGQYHGKLGVNEQLEVNIGVKIYGVSPSALVAAPTIIRKRSA